MAYLGRNQKGVHRYRCDDCGEECSVGTKIGPPHTSADEKTRCVLCHPKAEARAVRLREAASDMLAALKVVTLDLNIRAWFAAHDPKALEQAEAAIAKAEGL